MESLTPFVLLFLLWTMFLILFLSIFCVMRCKLNSPGNPNGEPNDNNPWVSRNQLLKLTNLSKSCDYTCSFCFKTFASAQALGGHQNAHKSQRREEKRLGVKDHINYRKRAFIESRKSVDVAEPPNGPKQLKAYHGEGSPGNACMAANSKEHGSSSLCINCFHPRPKSNANKPILPVPNPKGEVKDELDLTLKL